MPAFSTRSNDCILTVRAIRTCAGPSARRPDGHTPTLGIDFCKIATPLQAWPYSDALLAKAGSDKTKVLRAEIFLADMADFAGMNSVWDEWVVAGHTPARATVQAALARPQWKVEIIITAAL